MQTFLKIVGFLTIFGGMIAGIYIISDALHIYAAIKTVPNPYLEQVYLIKMVAGGAIIITSVVSGMLYVSFGIVIEQLDSMNHKMTIFLEDFVKMKPATETEKEEEY